MRSTPRITFALVVVAALALAGCAPLVSRADQVVAGVPGSWEGPPPDYEATETLVGWVGPEQFGVVTWGSSSCPLVAEDVAVVNEHEVRITFADPPDGACTDDLAPTTHVFTVPSAVEDPITVTVGGVVEEVSVELPMR